MRIVRRCTAPVDPALPRPDGAGPRAVARLPAARPAGRAGALALLVGGAGALAVALAPAMIRGAGTLVAAAAGLSTAAATATVIASQAATSTTTATPRAGQGAPVPATPGRPSSFRPCRLEHPTGIVAFPAECATLRVPEDPQRTAGRTIELAIARVAAISRRKSADPLFLVAGGPGMGTQAMYPMVAAAFARIGRDRDLVLLDQRGTGRSASLACELGEDDLDDGDPAQVSALTQRCLASLRGAGRDVRPYTTSVAVQDLERVRAALGYERINLYGVSYGTRVAQHYLRRFPQRVRSVVLDGVVPPGLALGPAMALDAEAALARILARCRTDAACRAAFGDPTTDYRALRAALAAAPVALTVADPATGTPRALRFGARHLAAVLRLASYADAQASLLPMALHEAQAKRNFTPLAGLFLMSSDGLRDSLAYGMHNTVVCSEDLPFVDAGAVDRARLAATYLGTAMLDSLRAICGAWPTGPVDADFRDPLSSDVPVLLLSGSDDPVTPPAGADVALRGLARARHLVVDGHGHGQVGVECMDRVLADFLREADPARLDATCVAKARPAPFFTSPSGPPP
jgi:pimeloyl-ACP methyl ester carboxylesterase